MKFKTKDISAFALFIAFFAICAYIQIPSFIPFTMQLFALALSCLMLGGKKAAFISLVYVLSGTLGLPVFSGFSGGISHLLAPSGGFLIFLPIYCILYAFLSKKLQGKIKSFFALFIPCIFLYLAGSLWFFFFYAEKGFFFALASSVLPFVIPDIAKLLLAQLINKRLNLHALY